MLTKAQIVDYINKSAKLRSICTKLVRRDLVNDLLQELSLIVLEYPQNKLNLIKSIDGFLIKILYNMTNRTYGTFSRKYVDRLGILDVYHDRVTYENNYTLRVDDGDKNRLSIENLPDSDDYNHSIDIDYQKALKVIDKIEVESDDGYYMANLFRIYMREKSIRKVNKLTGIPVMSIQWSLKKFKEQVKKRI